MEITITRLQSTLNNVRYISWPDHYNYHYINCSFKAQITAFGLELVLFANTSGTYNNNTDFPSNDLVVVEMKTSRLVYSAFTNKDCRRKKESAEDFLELNKSLTLLISNMQETVTEWEDEAKKLLADDDNIYIETAKQTPTGMTLDLLMLKAHDEEVAKLYLSKMEESVSESRRAVTKEYAATTYPWMFEYEA